MVLATKSILKFSKNVELKVANDLNIGLNVERKIESNCHRVKNAEFKFKIQKIIPNSFVPHFFYSTFISTILKVALKKLQVNANGTSF